jgi:hypothetical protein
MARRSKVKLDQLFGAAEKTKPGMKAGMKAPQTALAAQAASSSSSSSSSGGASGGSAKQSQRTVIYLKVDEKVSQVCS